MEKKGGEGGRRRGVMGGFLAVEQAIHSFVCHACCLAA